MVDTDLADLARLIGELGQVLGRLKARQLADSVPKRCASCNRYEQPWVPILDAQGRTTGWRGPTCARRRDQSGAQLPLEQEGADGV